MTGSLGRAPSPEKTATLGLEIAPKVLALTSAVVDPWVKVRLGIATYPRRSAIAEKLGVATSLVVTTVLALATHAARHQSPGTVRYFDLNALAAFVACDPGRIVAIIKALMEHGVIAGGQFPGGDAWDLEIDEPAVRKTSVAASFTRRRDYRRHHRGRPHPRHDA